MAKSPQPKIWRNVLPIHPAADLFPLMSKAELRELGADIKTHGLKSHLKLHKGKLLDGRNRLDAMELVGVRINWNDDVAALGCPFDHLDEQVDPYAYVISANIHRRHLTVEQKRDLIEKLLKAKPQSSDRIIAKQTKVDHKTVGKARSKLEATGEIPQLKKTVGADGKSRSKRTPKPAAPPIIELGRSDYSEVRATSVPPKSRPGSVSAKDIALEDFSARAMELVRLTRNKGAERFAKTALSDEDIGHLAKFFTDLTRIRQGSGLTRQSAEVSTEQRKAEHAALDGASS
jgi:hypothetical protein